uniref:60S acidic ribosomal protein P0 n=1 Tax=Chromera velia CCMP2878 TaxID=1169474 RepID=A0A0G4HUY0_9ALVE|mmetsp:Transcript_53376/g.104394  ORF Transcript_53376/g.104394 Transcript_53376/m.104394 type:complete len:315 (+) Transcript_53376:130-1074(+)|eukprot:Cvel_8717.t1-p1 / transcript=Cvel_8717.t1 / gene=Cvel_8717 / organism=Chromera_velia_CCMP2878 / gene_product=60S acidic ribosomal protein P0, putative / transcript_product=60S acidic ribosomal protein P0, putative / location=Cvel_scaffold487:33485-37175(-) / protein_length=314 / sequence_SO=supercontig / SO=protein_coding / is_pseudo=false
MPKLTKRQKKDIYFEKLAHLIETYPQILVVSCDNVGSKQMAEVRFALRGKAILLFGKNTMMRRCLRNKLEEHPEYQNLINQIQLNVGFVFCIADINEVREAVTANKVPAAARQGAIAPVDVHIPAGPCGLDPAQTSFFQALGIATKITKGQIEIIQPVHIVKKGLKVAASQAALLQKLGLKPFMYGLEVQCVYDHGSVFDVAVLDITTDVLIQKFQTGLRNIAALSLATHIPTAAALPHLLLRAYKNCVGLVIDSDYTFPQMEMIRAYLADPSAFAVAAAPAAASGGDAGAAAAPVAAAVEEEEEEAMDFDLFD